MVPLMALLVGLLIGATPTIGAEEPLPNLGQVTDGIYRGAQPEDGGLQKLAEMGVRTVINFRTGEDGVAKERSLAEKLGLRFIHEELPPHGRPSDESIRRILDLILDPENQPVFVHCKRGADRTGTVIACYRMEHAGWTEEQAMDEAAEFGIGWWQRGMKAYIRDRCGSALNDAIRR